MAENNAITQKDRDGLLCDLKALIDQGRTQAVAAVNSALIEVRERLAEQKSLETDNDND